MGFQSPNERMSDRREYSGALTSALAEYRVLAADTAGWGHALFS